MIKRESIFRVSFKGGKGELIKARDKAHAKRVASKWGEVLAVDFVCEDVD